MTLEAIHLSKAFEDKQVIRDFSARFAKGSHTCLRGPSGSGKTTLLRLLMGLTLPDSGEVRPAHGMRCSAMFQEDRLLEHLTAEANVRFATHAPVQAIRALLCEMGIEQESLPLPVAAYSGGMKRRVALCRALLADYDMLVLDEPYKGLDSDTKALVERIVAQRTQGKTVLLVTHDAAEAAGYDTLWL